MHRHTPVVHPPAPLRLTGAALQTAILVHRYYDMFNERRFDEAESLVDPQAVFSYPAAREHVIGRAGYRELARRWVNASADGRVRLVELVIDEPDVARVSLVAEGTHTGVLELSGFPSIAPTHRRMGLPMRETLAWSHGRVAHVRLEFDLATLRRLLS